ncbi:MAG: hypothetical protein ACRCWF_01020 [Beijerinckiaceae bacterium]
MKTQSWFQKDIGSVTRTARRIPAAEPRQSKQKDMSGIAARLRPHELIAMLTHHYTRVRSRSMPKVKTTLAVHAPNGKAAVMISFG